MGYLSHHSVRCNLLATQPLWAHRRREGWHSQRGGREAGGLACVAGDTSLCFHAFGRYFGSTYQEIDKCSYPFISSCEWIPKKIAPGKETIIGQKQFIATSGPGGTAPQSGILSARSGIPTPPTISGHALCLVFIARTIKANCLLHSFVWSLSLQLEAKLHESRDFPAVSQVLNQNLAHSHCSINTH